MLNKRYISKLNLQPGTIASLALYDHLYSKHPDKIKKVLQDHDQHFIGDRSLDFLQIYNLSKPVEQGGRGRFFTETFSDAAKDAGFENTGNLGHYLSFTAEDLGNLKDLAAQGAAAAASGGANVAADAGAAKSLGSLIKGLFSKSKPVEVHDVFEWPPESEFPKDQFNQDLTNTDTSIDVLKADLSKAIDLQTDYNRQVGVHTAAGNTAAANNVTIWRNKAGEFVTAFKDAISGKKGGVTINTQDVKNAYSNNNGNTDLNDRDAAKKIKELMSDPNDTDDNDKILGIEKKTFWTWFAVGAVILVLAIIIWLYMRKRKRDAAKKITS